MMKNIVKPGLAVIAGFGIAMAGAVSAMAVPTIDPVEDVSLNLVKYERPSGTLGAGDGNKLPEASLPNAEVLHGVKFTACKVADIDLATNAGWQDYRDLEDSWDGDPANVTTVSGSCVEKTTDANGVISWDNEELDGLGVFLVTETGFSDDFPYDPVMVAKSAPFLISAPVVNAVGNGWNYDVWVYPKNTIVDVEKTVEDGDVVKVGDTVKWNVYTSIHNDLDGVTYKVVDKFDSRLTYGEDQKTATTVMIVDRAGGAEDLTLTAGVDYTITVTKDGDSDVATVEMTSVGFEKLEENLGANVKITFPTVVNATVNDGLGGIENEAVFFPNESYVDGVPSNKVESKWGGKDVIKKDHKDATLLAGAEFEVWSSHSPLTDAGLLPGDAVKVIGAGGMSDEGIITTGDDGVASVTGLRYSDWANGGMVSPGDPEYNYYFLVEVKAPQDYNLLANPIQFTVTEGDGSSVTQIDVLNTKNPDSIPTGGQGVWLSILVGGALIGTGVGAYVVSRKRAVEVA